MPLQPKHTKKLRILAMKTKTTTMKNSPALEIGDSHGQEGILSKLTDKYQKDILEQNWKLFKLQLKQHAEQREERNRIHSKLNCSLITSTPENAGNQHKSNKMVNSLWYCSGAKMRAIYLNTLQSHFSWHSQVVSTGDSNNINYAVFFLDSWNYHPHIIQQQMENTDPSERASDPHGAQDPSLKNWKVLANNLQKMQRDWNRRLNLAMNDMQVFN